MRLHINNIVIFIEILFTTMKKDVSEAFAKYIHNFIQARQQYFTDITSFIFRKI